MKWLALLLTLFLAAPVLATSVTVDVYGTNVSNAQSNLTKTGNNSYQVVQWAVGDTTKSLKADINGNASDDITFTLHNFTVNRVIEVKVNSSAFNSYQADSTGTISFTRTQTVRNQTYSFTPAVNAGGYNFTWAQFWTYPSLFGLNFTSWFLPYSGATQDLNMNGKNITNVTTINSTTVNVTIFNATNIQGNGSGISSLNAANLTGLNETLNNASVARFTYQNVTNSRAKDTIYQNTNSTARHVAYCWVPEVTGVIYSDVNTPPTIAVIKAAGGNYCGSFIVLAQYYYKWEPGATGSLNSTVQEVN